VDLNIRDTTKYIYFIEVGQLEISIVDDSVSRIDSETSDVGDSDDRQKKNSSLDPLAFSNTPEFILRNLEAKDTDDLKSSEGFTLQQEESTAVNIIESPTFRKSSAHHRRTSTFPIPATLLSTLEAGAFFVRSHSVLSGPSRLHARLRVIAASNCKLRVIRAHHLNQLTITEPEIAVYLYRRLLDTTLRRLDSAIDQLCESYES
jgi:hypothetical protein